MTPAQKRRLRQRLMLATRMHPELASLAGCECWPYVGEGRFREGVLDEDLGPTAEAAALLFARGTVHTEGYLSFKRGGGFGVFVHRERLSSALARLLEAKS